MPIDPARFERHLVILDEIAEVGLVLLERLRDYPRGPKQDVARDYDIITRSMRRSILLSHTLASGKFVPPQPAAARPERPESDRSGGGEGLSGDSTRLDPLDRLDDVSGPFQHIVATILQDMVTVLARVADPPPAKPHRRPDRPEADLATLE